MDPSENTHDKIQPRPSTSTSVTYLLMLIFGVQVLVALVTYPFLPDRIPTHWDAYGNINGYMPKWIGVPLFPFMSIGIYLLIRLLYTAGPNLGNQNPRTNVQVINHLLVGVFLLDLVMQLAATAVALHVPIDMAMVVNLSVSVLFIFIGNYMVKLRRNFWGGIRTPWTLANDTVWERTHRLGGWLFVGGGLVGIVLSFIPAVRIVGIATIAIIVVLISTIYSYIVYQRVVVKGNHPLSPPFDENGAV